MIGGRHSEVTVQRLSGATSALNELYHPHHPHHRLSSAFKPSVINSSLISRDLPCGNVGREFEVINGKHSEAVQPGGPFEDSTRRVLPRRTSLRFPGSITGHPAKVTDTKTLIQKSLQNGTVNGQRVARSRLKLYSDTSNESASSGDETQTVSVSESVSQKMEQTQSEVEVEPQYVASSLSLSPQLMKPVVRKRKDDLLSSSYALTESDTEDGQDETDASERSTDQQQRRKRKPQVTVNLSGTRYEVVRDMVEYVGFIVGQDHEQDCFLVWSDCPASNERIAELKPYQHINHFPGMGEICRKDCLARNMAKMAKTFPLEYNFVPKTWILPSDYASFQSYAQNAKKSKKRGKTFIMKPANGAMGNGIQVIRCADKVPSNEHIIVQEYIEKPFVVDGFKCDMRIYVLITSCDPLRIFLFNDGLLRMSTEPYVCPTDSNLDHSFMHLTNYSINKHSINYRKDEAGTSGSKRSLRYFSDFLRRQDHDVASIWNAITDLIIKTMIVAHPHIFHAYRMCRPGQSLGSDSVCFEILGFDVMLDRKLRPWLLEVNRSPSFGIDEQLDYDIKSAVIEDALRLVRIRPKDKKKNLAEEKAKAQRRLLKTNKRQTVGKSEVEKQRDSLERRKEELNALLDRVRRDDDREEYENRHIGRYRRIFPPVDRLTRVRYANLMASAYQIFLSGRQAQSLNLEIQRLYSSDLKEYEIREMLAQCDADEVERQQQQQQQHTLQSLVPVALQSKPPATDGLMSKRLQRSPSRWPIPISAASHTSRLGRRNSFTPSATLAFTTTSHTTCVRLE